LTVFGKVPCPASIQNKENGRSYRVTPTTIFGKAQKKQPPLRQPYDANRSREYLMADEVERMITATRRSDGRLAKREALFIMTATAWLSN
jgi:hypothetical protein